MTVENKGRFTQIMKKCM